MFDPVLKGGRVVDPSIKLDGIQCCRRGRSAAGAAER